MQYRCDCKASIFILLCSRYNTGFTSAHGENGSLRRIDNSAEALHAEHSHVADGEGAPLELLRCEFAVARTGSEIFDGGGDI